MVVEASDSNGPGTLEIAVTITNMDVSPSLAGPYRFKQVEDGPLAVVAPSANDPGVEIAQRLAGSDSPAFFIDGGQLRFRVPPGCSDPDCHAYAYPRP